MLCRDSRNRERKDEEAEGANVQPANHGASVRPSFFPLRAKLLDHHQTSFLPPRHLRHCHTSRHPIASNSHNPSKTHASHHIKSHQTCLASPAVPPLRPGAPPSLLLRLALLPSSLLRFARPAPSLNLLPPSTPPLLLPPLLNRLLPQRAAVAVSSARWPALLRELPQSRPLQSNLHS